MIKPRVKFIDFQLLILLKNFSVPKKRKRNPVDGDDENGHDEKKNDENAPNGEGLEDEKEDDDDQV